MQKEMKSMKGALNVAVLLKEEKGEYFFGRGWVAASGKCKMEIVVKDEFGNILPTIVEADPKGQMNMDAYVKPEEIKTLYGFRVTLPLDEKTGDVKKISVYAKTKDSEVRIYKNTLANLKKRYNIEVMNLYVEGWKKDEKETSVRGWCFHKEDPFELKVYGSNGKEIPAEIAWSRRYDLERIYFIENSAKRDFGYAITIPTEELSGDKIKLVLSSGKRKLVRKVDLSKQKRPEAVTLWQKMLRPEKWKKAFFYLKNLDFETFRDKIKDSVESPDVIYHRWFLGQRVKDEELETQRNHVFAYNPKISIVIPLFNTKEEYLKDILDSILEQSYSNLELCLADGSTKDDVCEYIKNNYDDSRIVYHRLAKNDGIAGNTNAALAMATGDFVALCDHDDVLERNALFEIVKLYNEQPDLDIIYTDEDLTDAYGRKYSSPRFKPDFNMELLQSINYVCHIFVVKKSIMDEVGGFRKEYDGAQDWDLILRCCEKSERIGHVPKILYHWRAHELSTAGNIDSKQYAIDAGRKAVEDHFKRIGVKAELDYTDIFIMFRAKLFPEGEPKVSIVIPNKDQKETLQTCLDSIFEKTTYKNYEIIIVENNSTTDEIYSYYEELKKAHANVKVVRYEGDFNYSKINNYGATFASGEYLILLNNDTEVISADWMERMLGYCQRESTGMVGAKLYYPDDTIQHCGVVIGVGGFAGHILTLEGPSDEGYLGRLKAVQDISAVTAACLMIKKSVFDAVGGLDEDFVVALNDVDLCLKVRALGKLIVLDPGVELYHHESKSRGLETTPGRHERFKTEIRRFRDKWKDVLEAGDPYYNPNLTLMYGDFSLRSPDEHFAIVDEIESEE